MQPRTWTEVGIARWQAVQRFASRRLLVALLGAAPLGAAIAAPVHDCTMSKLSHAQLKQLDVYGWLERMQRASDINTYSGTFLVMSSSGVMSSSKVWHVCSPESQIERMEALSGSPRVIYRQSSEVRTFMPPERLVRIETREMGRKFPRADGINASTLSAHYVAQMQGHQRVAGKEADALYLRPRDTWRFGYRAWLDHDTGLILKWQTVAPSGRVLEEAAFSDLELGTPVSGQQIESMMNDVVGYRVISEHRVPATLEANGWQLAIPVDGFVLLNCSQKQKLRLSPQRVALVQCVYSDGLASISLFIEPYQPDRHPFEGQELRLGATHTFSGRVAGDAWVTMVGEVPMATLRRFASAIKHTEP